MPSGTQEQQRPVMEKPCRPVLLIGVTVNPDKGQGHRATALSLSWISIVLRGQAALYRQKQSCARDCLKGKTSRGAEKKDFICLFVC